MAVYSIALVVWLLFECVHAPALAAVADRRAAKGDFVVLSAPTRSFPAKQNEGSDVAVFSPSGALKASIHGKWSGDDGISTVVSSDGKYHFAIGMRSLGPSGATSGSPRGFEGSGIGVTRIAGGSLEFLGIFGTGVGEPDIVTYDGNQLAAGPVTANGSVVIYATEVFDSDVCPGRYGASIGSNVVTLRFDPKTLKLTRVSQFEANRIQPLSFSECFQDNSVATLRTIGTRIFAVQKEPQGSNRSSYVLRYFDAKRKRSGIIAQFKAGFGTRVFDAEVLSPTSFVVRAADPNFKGLKDLLIILSKGKAPEMGTAAPGKGDRVYTPGIASFGSSFLTVTGARHGNLNLPSFGDSVWKWKRSSLRGSQLATLAPKFNGLDLTAV